MSCFYGGAFASQGASLRETSPDSLPLGHAARFLVNSQVYGGGTALAISGHAGNSTEFHLPRTVPFRLLRKVGGTVEVTS